MNRNTVHKGLLKRIASNGRKSKKVVKLQRMKKELHKRNNMYGQYLLQESKDIDRTIKSLDKIFMQ